MNEEYSGKYFVMLSLSHGVFVMNGGYGDGKIALFDDEKSAHDAASWARDHQVFKFGDWGGNQ